MALALGGCKKNPPEAEEVAVEATTKAAPEVVQSQPLAPLPRAASATPHPRIILDEETRARLAKLAHQGTPAWERLEERCALFRKQDVSSGYYGLQWSEAVASLALCYHATGDKDHAARAIHYLGGLLDDREKVGDGKGGAAEIERNSGYPIRARGVMAALAYDWLYHAPGMTAELRAHIIERLRAWIAWYQRDGYLNDDPFSNYFWGYATTVSLAGLAAAGDDPIADTWLNTARKDLLGGLIVPGFRDKLAGGGWAEGWQYGPRVATEAAMVLRGFATATGARYTDDLPWLAEIVSHHLYALRPAYDTAYANATHIRKPHVPDPDALRGVTIALDSAAPTIAAEARFIVDELYEDDREGLAWLAFLTDRPGAPRADPRKGAPLAYHASGPGLTFARSSWQPDAVWVAFQAGPRVSVDHQHNDQGHFELWRGDDALFLDGGNDTGVATINHNSLLIDDGGQFLSYTPNQGVWGYGVSTTRFAADDHVVVAVGDITDAYDPGCVRSGCKKRAVKSVVRTLVYVRPNLLVIRDRVTLSDPRFGATWIAHALAPFDVADGRFAVTRGDSRAWGQILSPAGATPIMRKEPTTAEDYIYLRNTPFTDMWRVDIASPRGESEREFLVWMTAAAKGAERPKAARVRGKGLAGGIGKLGGGHAAVLFAESDRGGHIALPISAERVVIVGLEPGSHYGAVASKTATGCRIEITRAGNGKHLASAGGTLTLHCP